MTPLLSPSTSASHVAGWLILTAALVVWAAVYACSCWLWPYRHCPRCEGAGRHMRDDGKVFRPCRRCKGSGRRLRIGRRIWNYHQARRKAAE